MWDQLPQDHWMKRSSSSPVTSVPPVCYVKFPWKPGSATWLFPPVHLLSFLAPTPHHPVITTLEHKIPAMSLGTSTCMFLLHECLNYSSLLFHMHFRFSLGSSLKNPVEILTRITLKNYISLGRFLWFCNIAFYHPWAWYLSPLIYVSSNVFH